MHWLNEEVYHVYNLHLPWRKNKTNFFVVSMYCSRLILIKYIWVHELYTFAGFNEFGWKTLTLISTETWNHSFFRECSFKLVAVCYKKSQGSQNNENLKSTKQIVFYISETRLSLKKCSRKATDEKAEMLLHLNHVPRKDQFMYATASLDWADEIDC
jgi:hypothetical protein